MFPEQASGGRGRGNHAALSHALEKLTADDRTRYSELKRMLRSFVAMRTDSDNVFEEEVKPLCAEVDALEDKMKLKSFARFDCEIFRFNLDRVSDYIKEARGVMSQNRRLVLDDLEDLITKRRRNRLPTKTVEDIRRQLQL